MTRPKLVLATALCSVLLLPAPPAGAGQDAQAPPGGAPLATSTVSREAPLAFGGNAQYAVYPPPVWSAEDGTDDTAAVGLDGGYLVPSTEVNETSYWATIDLPFGASIDSVTGIAYDAEFEAYLEFSVKALETSAVGGSGGAASTLASDNSDDSGYQEIPLTLDPPVVVRLDVDADADGHAHVGAWIMEFHVSRGALLSSPVGFWGAVVHWRRTISPAPATATFSDVSTEHWAFPFVEALAASGITAGCSEDPPLYCPDDPITRAQMAIYLSAALGLHWPQ